jgi:FeS assembly SUF system regulator
MIKISRLADYAVVVLTTLAKAEDAPLSAAELARASHLPEPTVAKVLKLLAQDNLVLSTRGAGGGYALSREPNDISLAEIIMAVDGPIALTSCVEGGDESCEFSAACPSKDRWGTVSGLLRSVLEKIALGDMIERKGIFDPVHKAKEKTDQRDYFN